jgi:hypothetical protein
MVMSISKLSLAPRYIQVFHVSKTYTGWPGNDVPAGSPQEAPTWGPMGAS